MKRIFVGSSTEGIAHAEIVAALLSEVPNVKAILWPDAFELNDITLFSIQKLSNVCSGAVFLATPDDTSVIRGEEVKTPRANVIFEYAFLSALLTRRRVALCRFSGVELPSDFSGLTHVPMGVFAPTPAISHQARVKLRNWAAELPDLHADSPATRLVHGYSGVWDNETNFELWRRRPLSPPNYAFFKGQMFLNIPTDGNGGTGFVYGVTKIWLDECYAEFAITDRIKTATVGVDGTLLLRSATETRQLLRLEGTAPQPDGFEPKLTGAEDYDTKLSGGPDNNPANLVGEYLSHLNGEIYSKAKELYWR